MSYFTVDILTPSEVVARDLPADQILLPTTEGEVNILPHHTHYVAEIGAGVLTVQNADKKSVYSMTSGLCKVVGDKITVLSTTCERKEKIDKTRAERALEKAEAKLISEDLSEEEFIKYSRKVERARVRILLSLTKD